MKNSFLGPLFIVGLSRSGTKLFRDVLNNHSLISIPENETHFIPKLIFENTKEFNFNKSFRILKKTNFYKKNIKKKKIDETEFRTFIQNNNNKLNTFIEFVLRSFSNYGFRNDYIWGDKTPKYLRNVDLLLATFPNAKIIHIIRDPRDRAISLRRTWWRSLRLAAYNWNSEITYLDKIDVNNRCLEIKFEDFLTNTNLILTQVCEFLDIEFEKAMLTLKKPSEKYGKASKSLAVLANNKNKYTSYKKKKVKMIEEICYPKLIEKGYSVLYAKTNKKIPAIIIYFLKLYDFFMIRTSEIIKRY